ncbi:RidA family protein [Azorhizobium caulinodans]|nr:RidA family protein [Azorhizobium caulinodans]
MHEILQPEGWAKPIGYANGVLARGRQIWVGGQIGWSAHQAFESDDLVDQVRQTLLNIVAVLAEGGAEPQHIVSMTWYFVDKQEYLARLKEIGAVYREVLGRHYPAMAAVQVVALMEDRAKVEIQATAVVPE